MPVVLKGISSPEDAVIAAEMSVEGARKNASFAPFLTPKKRSFYQDRLGTSIRRHSKQVMCVSHRGSCRDRNLEPRGAELGATNAASFALFYSYVYFIATYTKNDHFAKHNAGRCDWHGRCSAALRRRGGEEGARVYAPDLRRWRGQAGQRYRAGVGAGRHSGVAGPADPLGPVSRRERRCDKTPLLSN